MLFLGPVFLGAVTGVNIVEHSLFTPFLYAAIFGFIIFGSYWFSKSNTEANQKQLKKLASRLGFRYLPPEEVSVGQQVKLFMNAAWALNESAVKRHNERMKLMWARLEGEREGRPMLFHTFTRSHGRSAVSYSQFTLKLINKVPVKFEISREGFESKIEKFFGVKDIQIGDPDFDHEFMIRSDNEPWLSEFLDKHVRTNLLALQSLLKGELSLKDGYLMYEEATDFVSDECRERFEKIIDLVLSLARQADKPQSL